MRMPTMSWLVASGPVPIDVILDNPSAISNEMVGGFLGNLSPGPSPIRWLSRRSCVLRTERHAISWARNYVSTESAALSEEFVSDVKSYQAVVMIYEDVEVKFVFRLMTKGLDGFTEYGIGIKRSGVYYACVE